jgi:hypothetical protein
LPLTVWNPEQGNRGEFPIPVKSQKFPIFSLDIVEATSYWLGNYTKFGFDTPFFSNPPNLEETFRWNVSTTRKENGLSKADLVLVLFEHTTV